MHRFVSQEASSRHAEALFPLASMHALMLFRTPEFELNREVLRVDFDCTKQRFRFEYVEHPAYETWTKKRDAAAGFDALGRFLALKKWVV